MNLCEEAEVILNDVTGDGIKRLREIVETLYQSRLRWIEAAIQWHSCSDPSSREQLPSLTPEASTVKLAFQIMSDCRMSSFRGTSNEVREEIASKIQSHVSYKIREAGLFWGFHLDFLRIAIESGRAREEIISRIEDLSEAMTGSRRHG